MFAIFKEEDVMVPFDKIGDRLWDEKTAQILESYADLYGDELKVSVSQDEILATEERLGAEMPKSLKMFIRKFGIADIGEQLQDLDSYECLGAIWADSEYGPDFSPQEKTVLPFLITFSDVLGDGNLFCFHKETHAVYFFDHDGDGYLTRIFDDVGEYFKGCLIKMQAELADKEVAANAEKWVEKILREIWGDALIKKWLY